MPTQTDRAPDAHGHKVRFAAVRAFRDRVRRLPGGALIWQLAVGFVGLVVIVVGIILLPLPGPGWVIIFLGLGVWATEFDWAKRLLQFARHQVDRWAQWLKRQPRWLQLLVGTGLVVLVLACIVGAWYLTTLF